MNVDLPASGLEASTTSQPSSMISSSKVPRAGAVHTATVTSLNTTSSVAPSDPTTSATDDDIETEEDAKNYKNFTAALTAMSSGSKTFLNHDAHKAFQRSMEYNIDDMVTIPLNEGCTPAMMTFALGSSIKTVDERVDETVMRSDHLLDMMADLSHILNNQAAELVRMQKRIDQQQKEIKELQHENKRLKSAHERLDFLEDTLKKAISARGSAGQASEATRH
ncbi:hypothetical protein QBC41DRAFT_307721 [Cercophora samala]|uniref:Uncharacterized protein n=1 Tax=Cercophora samala TaxID=330535 RepID=A0AA39YXW5_9PEZI|nr:hypothetical protein QBC41DRAFT_307721 [Cercophora samala]